MAKSNFFFKTNLTLIERICLAGLFIALTTICQKVIAINYISAIPFVRISLGGPALIILSSILLGPWFGLLVGAASDLIGYFIFDKSGFGLFPQITAIYALLGFLGYFVFCLVRYIKTKRANELILYTILLVFFLTIGLTMLFNDSLTVFSTTYNLELWQRITIPSIVLGLSIILVIFLKIYDYRSKKKEQAFVNVYQIALANLILEVVVMLIFGSLMKGWAFSFKTYPAIVLTQMVVTFINVPLSTVIISYIIYILRRKFNEVSI